MRKVEKSLISRAFSSRWGADCIQIRVICQRKRHAKACLFLWLFCLHRSALLNSRIRLLTGSRHPAAGGRRRDGVSRKKQGVSRRAPSERDDYVSDRGVTGLRFAAIRSFAGIVPRFLFFSEKTGSLRSSVPHRKRCGIQILFSIPGPVPEGFRLHRY